MTDHTDKLGAIKPDGKVNMICTKAGSPGRWAVMVNPTPAQTNAPDVSADVERLKLQMAALEKAVTA